jgi:hypothetical protein
VQVRRADSITCEFTMAISKLLLNIERAKEFSKQKKKIVW